MTMTTLEMVIRVLVARVEPKLWDSTADDIVAPNGDIIGSSVTEYHHVNDTEYIKYTLTDSERGVDVDPSFTIIMMDGKGLACSIKIVFKKMDAEMVHDLDIAYVNINGTDMDLAEIAYNTEMRKIENMIMLCCTQL